MLLSGDHRLLYQYIVRDDFQPNWHKCTMCGKTSKDRGNLRKHVENIHFPGTFNYRCKYCFENFSTRNSLNIHISKDCKQKWISPLILIVCCLQDMVRTSSSMITLSKMALACTDAHSVEKLPVIGAILGSMLRTSTFLVHFPTTANTAMRPTPLETCWTCTFQKCIEIYNSSYPGGDKQLYDYIVSHPEAGPKAFKCIICGKISDHKTNLRKHVENIHFPGTFTYQCKYCSEIFTTRNFLNMHVSKIHSRNVQ